MVKHSFTILFFLFFIVFKTTAQDNPAKIVNDSYFECFGRIATDTELNSWTAYVKTHNATVNDLTAQHIQYIKDSTAVQREIIKKAYEDVYGNAPQNEMDSCFNSKTDQPEGVYTYQALINDLKESLHKNISSLQLSAIQRSYNDYFGVQVNPGDRSVKSWTDSSISDEGISYKTLMEQHRLYVIKTPDEQKAIINRSFNIAFGRDPKIAEMDSWFNACKNGGCAYMYLADQLNVYKKTHPRPIPPVLAPTGIGNVVYTRSGAGINEACNCTGEKMYLVNSDEKNTYKVTIASYSYKSNTTTTTEYIIAPKQEKPIGCTKDIECLYSIMYSVFQYRKI